MGTDRDSNTEHSSTSENGSAGDKDDLAVRLSELARELQSEQTPNDILEDLVRAAVQIIPGVDEASISMIIERKQVESRAPTSDLPVQVDALQMEVRQGPCLDAVFKEQTVLVSDTSSDPRWPEFGKRAYALGARACSRSSSTLRGTTLVH
ncbi:GAF domain-containing protein [Arthrobacter sp. EH-1B-1]|uniref:GAF domain-containing protein n=1 Tax=Arthrobacter vasquezii TaxID=2977629 RepID=A0ABT6CXN2_9MICC|nr:GAF domain-containing protein [Arthrobacter vasquezii]MDF9278854.1 GAF domain-containing protein [Arthrobacter vasquezii]